MVFLTHFVWMTITECFNGVAVLFFTRFIAIPSLICNFNYKLIQNKQSRKKNDEFVIKSQLRMSLFRNK